MKVNIAPGRYVLAVSGGVDSMVLLDLLAQQMKHEIRNMKHDAKIHVSQFPIPNSPTQVLGLELYVAHFNHGIRSDSAEDEKLVKAAAKKYGLKFETGYGRLGKKTSEAQARQARYKFLESVRQKHNAVAIITAHHQDDLIETAFINLLRGTGRRGLSSIIANPNVIRPLLGVAKPDIQQYAKKNAISWREDSTNESDAYLRNYIRSKITSKLKSRDKKLILKNIDKVAEINKILDNEIATLSHNLITNNRLNRQKFIMLPSEVADDVMMHWFRTQGFRTYDRKTIIRIRLSIKTARLSTLIKLGKGWRLVFSQSDVSLSCED